MTTITLGDLSFNVHDEGSGPAVLLLHGFPDSHRLWRHQIPALAGAGYRVIAPDLRGYGASAMPAGVDRYGLLDIIGDVVGILDSLGIERPHVVGHDWGAAVAWGLASFVADRVDHLAVLSVGHPSSFAGAGFEQRQKSWYMLLFQFEGVAEEWLSGNDYANFRAWSQHPDADRAVADLSRSGALTAALNWYRANVPASALVAPALEFPPVAAPTMGIWSSDDFALIEAGMTGSTAFVSGPWRYERIEGAGHWMQLEAPDAVNALLLDFLPTP